MEILLETKERDVQTLHGSASSKKYKNKEHERLKNAAKPLNFFAHKSHEEQTLPCCWVTIDSPKT